MDGSAINSGVSPADRYHAQSIALLEREKLWPKVWLMACRLEELKAVGDFVVFDIDLESIIVVRTAEDKIKAFYNVCQHRGRRLKEGCGNTGKFIFCPFHGWRWNIEGDLERVINKEDWDHLPGYFDDKGLQEVKLDSWAGWVFVSMDPDIEPLLDFLSPLPEMIKNFELENCRIAWYKTFTFPCNWKTVINAFNENYHVETTHAQLNKYGLSKAPSYPLGKHSQFKVELSAGSSNLGTSKNFNNLIETIEHREEERDHLLKCMTTEYSLTAAKRLKDVIPSDAPPEKIITKFRELHREELEKAGAQWPEKLTSDDIARAGIDIQAFPNMVFLPNIDGALVYRARPNPHNPEESWYDIWWIMRFAPGDEPKYTHDFYETLDDAKGVNPFLEQDFSNLLGVQKGIHSRGFKGSAYNPLQERGILHFESMLDEYLSKES